MRKASTFCDGVKVLSKSGMLHHALGLALVRMKRMDAALTELEQATIFERANTLFLRLRRGAALHRQGRSGDRQA
jgi:Flp pilus assembly protein TadD